jgi:tetratricopeptide (TPR) repeat protein
MNRSNIHTGAMVLAALLLAGAVPVGCKQQTGEPGPGPEGSAQASGERPYYQGLIEEYRSNLAEDPHNLAATIGLANALADAGQWREAIRYYEAALQIDPHNADVISDMGTCYRNLGNLDKALSSYDRALKIDSTNQRTLYNLGIVYGFDLKDYGKAVLAWDRLMHVAPNHPKAAYIREHIKVFQNRAGRGGGR